MRPWLSLTDAASLPWDQATATEPLPSPEATSLHPLQVLKKGVSPLCTAEHPFTRAMIIM